MLLGDISEIEAVISHLVGLMIREVSLSPLMASPCKQDLNAPLAT